MSAVPRALAPIIGTLLLVTGCSSNGPEAGAGAGSSSGKRIVIVTDMYPTTYAAQQVAGDAVDIVQLVPNGVEPHEFELTPGQITQIADADLVAHVPGIIPAVQEAVEQEAPDSSVDVTSGIKRLSGDSAGDHADASSDPHVWLDPANVTVMGENVARALTDRGLGSQWDTVGLRKAMEALDQEFASGTASCRIKPMVVSHAAFGYLANAYGFQQHAISGLSPEAEPSPAKLAEISKLVADEGVTTIYYEALVSPGAAETIARETGARTALLDPIEGSTNGKPYDTLMRENLTTLIKGQDCT